MWLVFSFKCHPADSFASLSDLSVKQRSLILMCVQIETNNPRPSSDAAHGFRISSKFRQAGFELASDPGQICKHPVGEFFFAQFIPYMFLRVEFRRIGRQTDQAHVFRHCQVLTHVGTRPIHHHDDEVITVRLTYLNEEFAHARGVHLSADHPIQIALQRTDRTIHIDKFAFIAVIDHRTLWCVGPAFANAHHAPETRLVLKHQTYAPASHNFGFGDGSQVFGQFFFQSSCACASLFGCRVSGATLRQPCRSSSRYTTDALTVRPNFCDKAARNGETTGMFPELANGPQGAGIWRSFSGALSSAPPPPGAGAATPKEKREFLAP